MVNFLKKPYTVKERANFVIANTKGFIKIEETEDCIWAINENEKIENGQVVVDPDYEKRKKEQEKLARILQIKAELVEIDEKSVRPLRAGEKDVLFELESKALKLRLELQNLETELVEDDDVPF